MKKIWSVLLAGAVIGLTVNVAKATTNTATANVSVSATGVGTCTVSTTAIAFGSYTSGSASAVSANGTFSITCSSGQVYSWSVGAGNGGSTSARAMTSTSSGNLTYNIYTDATYQTVMTASTGTLTGTGSPVVTTMYGQIPSGNTVVNGAAYSDSLPVTVTYTTT